MHLYLVSAADAAANVTTTVCTHLQFILLSQMFPCPQQWAADLPAGHAHGGGGVLCTRRPGAALPAAAGLAAAQRNHRRTRGPPHDAAAALAAQRRLPR